METSKGGKSKEGIREKCAREGRREEKGEKGERNSEGGGEEGRHGFLASLIGLCFASM